MCILIPPVDLTTQLVIPIALIPKTTPLWLPDCYIVRNGGFAGGGAMVLAKITGVGLGSIALSVTILWGCILGEHLIVQCANREFSQAMTQIRLMQSKKRAEPASLPAPHRHARPAVS